MTIQWVEPSNNVRNNCEGDSPLILAYEAGQQPYDTAEDCTGDLTVTIAKDNTLCFQFYSSTPSNHWEDPDEEMVLTYWTTLYNEQNCKDMAEMVLDNIKQMSEAEWFGLGFHKELA